MSLTDDEQEKHSPKPSRKRIWRKLVVWAFFLTLIVILLPPLIHVANWVIRFSQTYHSLFVAFSRLEPHSKYVIGDLGGVPVAIPGSYVSLVEYDGDPHWLERRGYRPPERTYASKLASFGMEVSFPELKVRSPFAIVKNGDDKYLNWLSVGIRSNSAYGGAGDEILEKYIKMNIPLENGRPYSYKKLPGKTYDLIGYTPIGVDESRRSKVGMADLDDKNIYYHRDQAGKADAYIECSNTMHVTTPCELRFNLLPEMRAHVYILFGKRLLPQWKEIQSSVKSVALSFRVDPSFSSKPRFSA